MCNCSSALPHFPFVHVRASAPAYKLRSHLEEQNDKNNSAKYSCYKPYLSNLLTLYKMAILIRVLSAKYDESTEDGEGERQTQPQDANFCKYLNK